MWITVSLICMGMPGECVNTQPGRTHRIDYTDWRAAMQSTALIRIKPTRNRKPTAPRTCCPTHTDTCKFGREHQWGIGWIGGPKSGLGIGEEGWHDSAICAVCHGICTADLEDGQVA